MRTIAQKIELLVNNIVLSQDTDSLQDFMYESLYELYDREFSEVEIDTLLFEQAENDKT